MATPFKPTLVSPGQRAASGTSVNFQFQFNAFGAGETLGSYSLRRRRVSPTSGTVEYWTGSAWSGSPSWITPGSTVNDKQIVSVTVSTGFSTGEVYEWSVDTRDSALSAGGFANNNILDVHTAPTVTAAASSTGETRPQIVWRFSGATGRRQKSYRWALYSAAVYGQAGFDPAVEYWQGFATWAMASPEVSSLNFRKRIGVDLANGVTYRMYGFVTDDTDLGSGWVNAGNFTTSFTAQAPPIVLATAEPSEGRVRLDLAATFNLLDTDSSIFAASTGIWISDFNCQVSLNTNDSFSKEGNSLMVVVGGGNYSYIDTNYSTYAAMDTALTTYSSQSTTQQPTVGQARVSTGSTTPTLIAVLPSTNYSAIASIFPTVTETVQAIIRWFKSDGTASTTAQTAGTATSCTGGLWTDINVNAATSPADAAFARVSLLVTTAAVGDVLYVDNVALARADSVQWSSGGTSVDIGFVVQRSDDGGSNWDYVWNNSHDAPILTNSATFSTTYYDRSVPMGSGTTIKYRVAAVSRQSTNPLYSTTVETSVDPIEFAGWWLRSVEDSSKDMKILLSKFSINEQAATQKFSPENATSEVVVHMSEPASKEISGSIWLINKSDYEKARTLLLSRDTLYIQRNVSDGFYFKCTGGVSLEQRASSSGSATPNHVHTANFSGTIVSRP